LQVQQPAARLPQSCKAIDVVDLHGSAFGEDLCIFHRLDGYSWAEALGEAGNAVWGFE